MEIRIYRREGKLCLGMVDDCGGEDGAAYTVARLPALLEATEKAVKLLAQEELEAAEREGKCQHEVDPGAVFVVDDDVNEEGKIVLDMKCVKCGKFGSVAVDPNSVDFS